MPATKAHLGAELTVEGEKWPVFVWTIDHPAGRVLVDTGMIDVRPEVDHMSPTPHPESIPRDIACVVNTHLQRPMPAQTFSEATWAPRSASSAAARPRDSGACSR